MDNADASKPQPSMDCLDWQAYRNQSLQPHGFGDERVRIWPRLVNVDDQLSEHPDPMESSIWSDAGFDLGDPEEEELDGDPHADEHQIGLDTDRSFVLYPAVSSREKLQTALNRLIISVFRRRPRLHYFQGYHDIVSVVFLTLPKELHIPVVAKLSLHRVRDSMGTTLEPVVGLLRVLKRLLELVDPEFAEALERTAPLPYYALSYLLTLFSHDVPTLPLIQHIFDYLLCRPPIAVVYLAAALTLTRRQEVQALEEEGEDGMVHSLLTVLPDLYEEGDHPPEPPMGEKPSAPQDLSTDSELEPKTETFEHVEPAETNVPAATLQVPEGLDQADLDGSIDVSVELSEAEVSRERASSFDASTDGESETLVDADELAQTTDGTCTPVTPSSPERKALPEPSESDKLSDGEVPKAPLLAPEEATSDSEHSSLPSPPSEDEKLTSASTRTPSPSPSPPRRNPRPRRPRISLTALLTEADALMRQYPPTHPDVALRTVMGPQSVVHTWAERARDLPPDDDAERMVDRPELVVCPPPPPSPLPSDDEDGGGGEEEGEGEQEGEEEVAETAAAGRRHRAAQDDGRGRGARARRRGCRVWVERGLARGEWTWWTAGRVDEEWGRCLGASWVWGRGCSMGFGMRFRVL
uniref:STE/STE11/CDC15 protein kinase n=1 Tax=Ganoderma boninense TaxID=34458 RepID=A0A5K1K2T2_9APHY|nr:STE/STE11/CDC15 protein kinase [Ganoderma boninense]